MYCNNCGKEIKDGSKYCNLCGSDVESTTNQIMGESLESAERAPLHSKQANGKVSKMHCPRCGSTNIQTIVKTNIHSSGKDFSASKACCGRMFFGPFGILCGSCGGGKKITSTNTSMHVCNDCGHEFKRRDDLISLIETTKRIKKIAIFIIIAVAVIGVISGVSSINSGSSSDMLMESLYGIDMGAVNTLSGGVAAVIVLIPVIPMIFFVNYLVNKNINKLTYELQEYDEAQRKYNR